MLERPAASLHALVRMLRQAPSRAVSRTRSGALGRTASSLVDNVVYDASAASPSFWVNGATGVHTITLDAATFGKTEAGQLIAGTHELVHAEQLGAGAEYPCRQPRHSASGHVRHHGPYAIREVVTGRRALQAVDSLLRGITPQQVGHSTKYSDSKRVVALGGSRVP
jgi:hypothetical protein